MSPFFEGVGHHEFKGSTRFWGFGFYGLGVVGFQVEISRFGGCLVWGSGFYVSGVLGFGFGKGSGLHRVLGARECGSKTLKPKP